MDDLGAKLRSAREGAGLSLNQMAKLTSFTRGYLGNVETGVRAVTPAVGMPWADATNFVATGRGLGSDDQLAAVGPELSNAADSGARWCSLVLLARTRSTAQPEVDSFLAGALSTETGTEHLRFIGFALAGQDPTAVRTRR